MSYPLPLTLTLTGLRTISILGCQCRPLIRVMSPHVDAEAAHVVAHVEAPPQEEVTPPLEEVVVGDAEGRNLP